MKCEICSHENDAHASFCENCGAPLVIVCPNCGARLKPGVKFCNVCGERLASPMSTSDENETLTTLSHGNPAELEQRDETVASRGDGERKPVTILFSDIVDSTKLAGRLDAEEWKEIVNGMHERVGQAVNRYGGTIAQLLGDGVLAIFGAPDTHEDDPIRAVRAALDIQQAISGYERELQGYIDSFQVRVGISTGTVVVGSVGSGLHTEYLAVGEVVNLAARLQSAAQPGKVLVSDSTARLVRATCDLLSLGKLALKGITEPAAVYEVVKIKTIAEGEQRGKELSSPWIGRAAELAELRQALEALLEGHGQIVSVIGEAGIGKSRLVEEVRRGGMDRQWELHWIEGRALSYGQTISYWPLTQLIYSDLGGSDGDPEFKVRAALKRRVNVLFAESAEDALPYLAHLLSVRLEGGLDERVSLLGGEALKRQTIHSICQYFERLAQERPTVAVFEDLHWADPSSLETLEELFSVTDRAPLMLLLLFRLERTHRSWSIKLKAETDFAHRYTEISLKPLLENEQIRLLDNLAAIADIPVEARHMILERAEGNPFYLEEIVRSLIDQGDEQVEDVMLPGQPDYTAISIPDTLQGLLLARIDRLQEGVRLTLQQASVIGKSFLYRLLQAISETDQSLDRHLALLQRADLVREKSRLPELEYTFKHSLTQEAAYHSLLYERRREFHRRVGEALERLFADRKEQFLGVLAYHFEAAGDSARAVDYLIQAGDRARLTDELTEAISFYQRASELLAEMGDEKRLGQVWLKLSLIYHANFQFEAAHQANEKAFELQQKTRLPGLPAQAAKPRRLRIGVSFSHLTLDPGKASWSEDAEVIDHLFSGLAKINEDLDVLPDAARSWQVLDGGRRYIFHLRSDMVWTDGAPVTAQDFEWAWKRNLDPSVQSDTVSLLFDVVGARDYNQGIDSNPAHVGARALDAQTLEVRLVEPVAYFPFIVSMPNTFPLPRAVIERYGESWWLPEHIVSNGAYRLVEFDAQRGGVMERVPDYPGVIPGNVHIIEWTSIPDQKEKMDAYREGRLDIVETQQRIFLDDQNQAEMRQNRVLGLYYLTFSPTTPPFDDLRVRKAFGLALDRHKLWELFDLPILRGGLVPPGMPGHSPDIGLPFDVDLARQLMREAGYPDGRGFPAVKGLAWRYYTEELAEIRRQWREVLGVEISIEELDAQEMNEMTQQAIRPLLMYGWLADYPDPDNFLRQSSAIDMLHSQGWQDPDYDRLVEDASRIPDRSIRMAMYRQADRFLVREQALVLPLVPVRWTVLVKPWVKNFRQNLLGFRDYRNMIVEDH